MVCPKCSSEYNESALACPDCGYSVLKLGKRPGKVPALPAAASGSGNKGGKSPLFNNLVSYIKTADTDAHLGNFSGETGIGEMRTFGSSRSIAATPSSPVAVEAPEAPVAKLPEARSTSFQKFGIQVEAQKTAELAPTVVTSPNRTSKPPRKNSVAKFDFKKQFDDLFANHKPNQNYDPKRSMATGYAAPQTPVAAPQYQVQPSMQTANKLPQAPASAPQDYPSVPVPQPTHAPNYNAQQNPPSWSGQFASGPAMKVPATLDAKPSPTPSRKPITSLDMPHLSKNSGAYALLGVMIVMVVGIFGLLLMINM